MVSIYGKKSIDKENYSWKLKLKNEIDWICIGVIEDNPQILKEYLNSNQFYSAADPVGGFLFGDGYWCYKGQINDYCVRFQDEDTVITMRLDMDTHSIAYQVNDKDYGVACKEMNKSKYRLVVVVYDNDSIQLL